MKKILFSLSVLLALCGVAEGIRAEKADRNKPMNVESDALRYDDLKQVSVFSGNVVLTKGSILIRGAQIEVRQDPEGYQYGLVTGAPGKQAFFRQKRDSRPSSARSVMDWMSSSKARGTPLSTTARPIPCASSKKPRCAVCGVRRWPTR